MLDTIESWGLLALSEWTILLRLMLAVVCGGVLGLERTRKRRPAGLRTYMLVCIGATVSMMTAQFMSQTFGGDPGRLPAQVISGIGFLGAGTIMVTRYYKVKGLTTAAGLWVAACMGLAIGIGFYFGAVVTCFVLIFVMIFADKFENRYTKRLHKLHLYIIFDSIQHLKPFMKDLRAKNIDLSDVETSKSDNKEGIGLFCLLKFPSALTHTEALALVESYEGVLFVEEIDY
ncbi:MAG: putative Mg(2+) transport ATPase [Firmicutes bacterium ADurb.Bin248]|jgi:putative Mg2+ transporter-C (MgtC) family protein|nr:MAG: putative Mg(2+) transport ATPase [Firmicutes bacterium ADurb.Bin248]HOG01180.1 MgtC/SapB family protein [Clostridia bacterium]HPK15964.1 MgtC/SapB family protein [Clostridia bacterium]